MFVEVIMASEKKVWDISKDPVALQPSEGNTIQVFIILFIIPFSVALCAIGCLYTSYHARNLNNTSGFSQPPVVNASQNISIKVRIIPKQPHCTSEEHITEVLTELIDQLKKANLRKFVCKPEDFIAEQSQEISLDVNSDSAPTQNILTEPRTHFVIYIAVGLLLVSLLTAFVDVYKVKGKPCKIKPQLTKRCSLADLTVLRHSRRESMKKDFITEEQRGPQKLQGMKVSRPLLHFNN